MALVCSVMAWGTEIEVDNFVDLKAQLSASGTADVVKLAKDIAYPSNGGSDLLDIQRSLTLDGNGYKLSGYAIRGAHTGQATSGQTGYGQYNKVTLVVNHQAEHSGLTVTLKDLTVETANQAQAVGVFTYDGISTLNINNCDLLAPNNSNCTPLAIYGESSDALVLNVTDSRIVARQAANYGTVILKPTNATIENSLFFGFSAITFKLPLGLYPGNRWTGGFGTANAGARGSVINATNSDFQSVNTHSSPTNGYGTFVFEEDGITMNFTNCGFNSEQLGNQVQKLFLLNGWYVHKSHETQAINVTISGDNSHINGKLVDNHFYAHIDGYENGYDYDHNQVEENKYVSSNINITISGGTYAVNPDTYTFRANFDTSDESYNNDPVEDDDEEVTNVAFTSKKFTIPSTHEVQTVNQGGVTLYRVVKKADGTKINDNAGQNEDKTIEVATGGDVALANETTEAGYVQVKNEGENATHVTVAKNNSDPEHSQTLIVNNGLDVLGASTVTVQPTAALVVGEGGITTQSASSIVIEADEDGSASLLLHPAITVNQTPELTVKMKAHVGKVSANNYEWHRFAIPVDEISSLPSTAPTSTTAIFTWDHAAQGGQGDWVSISALSDLDPFKGYTLTVDYDGVTDYVYTFTGRLTGNINTDLQLTHQGYNFFGNSYTGYIKLATLADAIIGNADLDATVWAWDSEHQVYGSVSLRALQEAEDGNYAHLIFPAWKREIAPMQTFILRLPNKDNATAEVDYASAIWGNPRYSGSTSSSAPARMAEIDGSIISMSISSENGSADNVLFMEKNAYSDDFENGYDAMKYMNENAVNMFVTVNGEDLSAVATDAIEGKMLTIQTGKAVNYTLTIDAALGAEYAIRDNVTNQVIAIEEGATYEFAAQPNSTIANRFEIVGRAQMPTAIENTEVKANVKGIYTIMGQYLGENFDILPAGVYVVDGVKIVK